MASHATLPHAASEGFKDAAAYDAHRPSYPREAVDQLLGRLKIAGQADARVVEIAAGTGKFTELLAARPKRYLVKAVEPHDGMRGILAAKDLPAVEVLEGRADKMPVEGEWGDACIAAQAFHWFATPEALTEIHRVLRAGAVFGVIWNIDSYNKPPAWETPTKWEQELNEWILTFQDGNRRFRDQEWKKVFEQQLPSNPLQVIKNTLSDHLPRFSLPLGEAKVPFEVWLTEDALWSRLRTLSQVAVLSQEDLEKAEARVREILKGDDVERNSKGELKLHGDTYFAWTDRI
ncbi:methyltransferase domain-containing protein [Microdochium trichocladiopsis]|uniref:Methyltransferase domain-containing protein n=1 Tax=Microdochium trichocladiopsis TaxID=1682393 RepID=A0A9P8Y8D8_9PEZI|nr:methyltransferase domain-containing protein [Microdochium trichocladiopsis]KAH7034849.1 methyltransferase domain-containing protein [Microdochium trichocladiopsis]